MVCEPLTASSRLLEMPILASRAFCDAYIKSRKVQGSIFGSRAVWHLWAMDFSVNRLDRKPSPPRCHLQQRAHLTGCPTF